MMEDYEVLKKKKIPWNKGLKIEEETRKKISDKLKGRIAWNKGIKSGIIPRSAFKNGHKLLPESMEKRRKKMIGKKCSEETKIKIGLSNTKEGAGKTAMHDWVRARRGKASGQVCEQCNKQAADWANKNHDYRRILDDYMALCRSCHRKYDFKYNNYKEICRV
jgi:hypothetical protein